ncbi:Hypothetical protein LUCI_2483 [Lucifera butyrica]|uniref:UvrD-like helicase C-terminal domain-containing protein n=2 Tax=Lucifera butyrica TaxID=1351585 RepID=A0A498R7N7_9FIRM|nr:Hypothetical protein LUCI_2483 [Lucifera butyrica]
MQQLELPLTDSNAIQKNSTENKIEIQEKNQEEITPQKLPQAPDILTFGKNSIVYTEQQKIALQKIAGFLSGSKESAYILSGYAGTGKTTIAENVVRYALAIQKNCIITAPTNQAVKVLKDKFDDINVVFGTLHSILYGSPDPDTGQWIPRVNFEAHHVVLVDESSMLNQTVYTDLIRESRLAGAKVIFFGDNFQLEPIGDDPGILKNKNFELTEVKRQGAGSEILLYATCLRKLNQITIPYDSRGEVTISGKQDAVQSFLQSVINQEDSIFIVGTNNARLALNQRARRVKFGENITDEPQNGDKILFIGNSLYFVNGDRLTLNKIAVIASKILPVKENVQGQSIPIVAYLIINDNHKIILLPSIEKSSVYHGQFLEVDKYFPTDWYDKNLATRKQELSKSVSIATYGYVITAHKSQGSQWEKVFVHQDAFRHNPRWLYTAVTRAEKELILTSESSSNKQTWEQIIKIANISLLKSE